MSSLEEKNKYDLINFWRFISSILVVAIHTVTRHQDLGYFIVVFSRIAVPFFFICSGYFLYNKLYENNKDVRRKNIYKYIKNIFSIYFLWSIIYLIFNYNVYFGNINFIKEIILLIRSFLFIGISGHLWYLSALCFSVYLLYLLIWKLQFKFEHICIISILLYIFSSSGDLYYGLIDNTIWGKFINVYIFFFGSVGTSFMQGLIFIVMGIGIRKYSLANKIKRPIIVVAISYVLFIIEHITLRYFNVISRDSNTSIFLLVLAPYIFITLLKYESKYNFKWVQKYSNVFKDISLTIYLIHPLIISIVSKLFGIMNINELQYESYIKFILVSLISIIISLVVNKVKVYNNDKKIKYIKSYN